MGGFAAMRKTLSVVSLSIGTVVVVSVYPGCFFWKQHKSQKEQLAGLLNCYYCTTTVLTSHSSLL